MINMERAFLPPEGSNEEFYVTRDAPCRRIIIDIPLSHWFATITLPDRIADADWPVLERSLYAYKMMHLKKHVVSGVEPCPTATTSASTA